MFRLRGHGSPKSPARLSLAGDGAAGVEHASPLVVEAGITLAFEQAVAGMHVKPTLDRGA